MWDAILAGAVTGYAIAVPVGAVAAYLVGLTARTSLRIGVAAALGVATTDGVYALLAVLGGSALATAVEPVADELQVVAGLLLVGVAVSTAVRAVRAYAAPLPVAATAGRRGLTPWRAWAALVVITAVNPATVVYFVAVVLGNRGLVTASVSEQVAFALAAFAASASWQLLVVSGGAALGAVLTGPRGRLVTALGSATVILVLAVLVLLP